MATSKNSKMKQKFKWRQAWTITRIELRRAFFSKRAFWVYALALFPSLIFLTYHAQVKIRAINLSSAGKITPAQMDSVVTGETDDAIIERLGKTTYVYRWTIPRRTREKVDGNGADAADETVIHQRMTYFDGSREARLNFENGKLVSKTTESLKDFEEDRRIFAGVFQFFYLRLAIFFGCLGIFMNLFRGEILDRTLHYWFLAPARREVLLAGKYGAGLIASVVIFTCGALLCFGVMASAHNTLEVQAFWQSAGKWHVFWYATAAAFGCVGYGSVFLAAGLLLRNPIIPATILLAWESINGFLPAFMQKASILYYLQSLCPVPAPVNQDTQGILLLLLTPAVPQSRSGAILGIMVITFIVLWLARFAVLRMQISYGNTE